MADEIEAYMVVSPRTKAYMGTDKFHFENPDFGSIELTMRVDPYASNGVGYVWVGDQYIGAFRIEE